MILEGGWWIAGAVSGGRQALGKPTEASFSHRQPRAARAPVWIAPTQATLMLEQTDTWCHRHSVSQTDSRSDMQTCCQSSIGNDTSTVAPTQATL